MSTLLYCPEPLRCAILITIIWLKTSLWWIDEEKLVVAILFILIITSSGSFNYYFYCSFKHYLSTKLYFFIAAIVKATIPHLKTMLYYAKAELTPPKVKDIPEIKNGVARLLKAYKSGAWKQVPMRVCRKLQKNQKQNCYFCSPIRVVTPVVRVVNFYYTL